MNWDDCPYGDYYEYRAAVANRYMPGGRAVAWVGRMDGESNVEVSIRSQSIQPDEAMDLASAIVRAVHG